MKKFSILSLAAGVVLVLGFVVVAANAGIEDPHNKDIPWDGDGGGSTSTCYICQFTQKPGEPAKIECAPSTGASAGTKCTLTYEGSSISCSIEGVCGSSVGFNP